MHLVRYNSSVLDRPCRTCTKLISCVCLLTWHHQPVDASISAFPADWSGIAPHAAHYPGDPLSLSHRVRPDRWHTTLGYRQTEKFKTHTYRGKEYTEVRFTPPDRLLDHQNGRTIREFDAQKDIPCHKVSKVFLFMLKWQITPTHLTQLLSVCDLNPDCRKLKIHLIWKRWLSHLYYCPNFFSSTVNNNLRPSIKNKLSWTECGKRLEIIDKNLMSRMRVGLSHFWSTCDKKQTL